MVEVSKLTRIWMDYAFLVKDSTKIDMFFALGDLMLHNYALFAMLS